MTEERIELARRHLADFALATNDRYDLTGFHDVYSSVLTMFARGHIKKLIISMPPQTGKSELSTRRLPAFMLGRNPDLKIAFASYSSTKARKFGRELKRIMNTPQYQYLFPGTRLPQMKDKGYTNSADAVDIVGHDGSVLFVGRGSGLTGEPVDILICDDLYKSAMEANSPVIREAVIDWYFTVADSRLHNDSQQLIVFTRWHNEDLVGWLEKNDTVEPLVSLSQLSEPSGNWLKLNFPAIMNHTVSEFDPRPIGAALWPERHSIERLERRREQDPDAFNSLYQGDPRPVKGLLYPKGFKEWEKVPTHYEIRSYTDTADEGNDFLCTVVYTLGTDDFIYILDVYYTDEGAEVTEPDTAAILIRNKVEEADIESNSGGRAFARNVRKRIEDAEEDTDVRWFHQSKNKEARILTAAATVRTKVLMPPNWRSKYPEFADHLLSFKKFFKANTHDDAPDVLTGVVEKSGIMDSDGIAVGVA